jgi:predicted lipid-binding transport protein (Tim44 family)
MSDGFAYLDIIFFAMIAAFIALRLRSVLGRRTGHERRRPDAFEPNAAKRTNDKVVALPDRSRPGDATPDGQPAAAAVDGPAPTGVAAIRQMDRSFDPQAFTQGARAAFTMIVEAFAKGDKDGLRPLLAPDVFQRFSLAIDDRSRRGETLSTELVAIDSAEIDGAVLTGSRARVTVRFESDQVNVTRNTQGEVVDGDATAVDRIVDLWTFERDLKSRDPNWQLVETRTPA